MAEGPDDVGHQVERGADQQLELLVGLVGVGEEPGQQVQEDLVGDRGDLGDAWASGFVITVTGSARSNGCRVNAATTGRAGSNVGSASRSAWYSSQIPRKRP